MIKLNAGFSRKVGEPNYGSRGASVNVDLELESALMQDPEKLHEKIRALFAIARKAVDEELKNGSGAMSSNNSPAPQKEEEPSGPVCSQCGNADLTGKVVEYSQGKFGRPLCYRCQKARKSSERKRR